MLLVAITAIGWGCNWPAMKVLLREWPPLFARGVAGVAAAILLAGIARMRGESLAFPRGATARLLFASFTNVFAWMGFSTMSVKYLNVSEGVLLVYTMPIWSTVFAWPVLGSRPTSRDVVSLLLGISGILILFGGQQFSLGPDKIIGIIVALAAATLFALGGVMNAKPIPMDPMSRVAWQVGLACVPMTLLGLIFEHPHIGALTSTGWWPLVYMTIGPMGICYLSWFAALSRIPAKTASMGTLLVPIVGSIAAALSLGEPLGARQVAAVILTLAGVALAIQKPKPAS